MSLYVPAGLSEKDRHPQQVGPGRWTFGARRRAHHLQQQVVRAHAALDVHAVRFAAAQPPTEAAALAAAHQALGKPYRVSGCRCSFSCSAQDCSGLICAAVNQVGVVFPCTSSFAIAIVCRQRGTLISEEQAIWTPGAIGIRGPHGGEGPSNGPNGTNGHIVFFEGDGKTTTEEMGRRYGCCHGQATGRGFVRWAHFPGLSSAVPVPARSKEHDVIVQTHHYNDDGSINRPTSPPDTKVATISVAANGSCLEARFDASIDNDHKIDGNVTLLRTWVPQGGLGAGITIVGVAERPPTQEDPHPGGVVQLSNGDVRQFHFS